MGSVRAYWDVLQLPVSKKNLPEPQNLEPNNHNMGELVVTMKVLVGSAITVAAALGVAAPASADPSAFNVLSCRCPQTVPNASSPATDKVNQGIQDGLLDWAGDHRPAALLTRGR
jgi:hypothetical protein